MYGSTPSLKAAVEAAAKLDAKLPKAYFKNTDVLKVMQEEYSINHCSQSIRTLLCKGATQERIRELCDAYVATKGRYIPEAECAKLTSAERSSKSFGLYLFIQGPNKRSIDMAIRMIENIISTGNDKCPPPSLNHIPTSANTNYPSQTIVNSQLSQQSIVLQANYVPLVQPTVQEVPSLNYVNGIQPSAVVQLQGPHQMINLLEKVPICIDNPLPSFNLPMKLIGQNGSNLHYIRNETGAVVTLRGIGSAFIEPTTGQESPEVLHFSIEHSKPEGLVTAKELVLNLIATVQQEYAQFQSAHGIPQQPNFDTGGLIVHQQIEGTMIQQPVMTTAITVPVVHSGIIQHPSGLPTQHLSQPPPIHMALPPPGVHIPQQTGPLFPQNDLQMQQSAATHSQSQEPVQAMTTFQAQGQSMAIQQQQTSQQNQSNQQQQYVITQGAQPVQGIMTSQGFVVLNQQPQQIIFSQPGGSQTQPTILHQGQIPIQSSQPVSYQLQYVQQSNNTIGMRPQNSTQVGQVVLHPTGQVQLQQATNTLQFSHSQVVGVNTDVPMQSSIPSQHGQSVVQVKHLQQHPIQILPYAPHQVQYVTSAEHHQNVENKDLHTRPLKRKFTDECAPQTSMMSKQRQLSAKSSSNMITSQRYSMIPPQPVPHPSQSQCRKGIGMNANGTDQQSHNRSIQIPTTNVIQHQKTSPPCDGADDLPAGKFSTQPSAIRHGPATWSEECNNQLNSHLARPEVYDIGFTRRDRTRNQPVSFNQHHFRNKSQTCQPQSQPISRPPHPFYYQRR